VIKNSIELRKETQKRIARRHGWCPVEDFGWKFGWRVYWIKKHKIKVEAWFTKSGAEDFMIEFETKVTKGCLRELENVISKELNREELNKFCDYIKC